VVERILPIRESLVPLYNQGREGACVGASATWMSSINNRGRRYDWYRLYKEAQAVDGIPGSDYSGTTVRAGFDVLRDQGHWWIRGAVRYRARLEEGITANRWALTTDEIRAAIDAGAPVVFGMDWLRNYWQPRLHNGEPWIGRDARSRADGGHAICCRGASDEREGFLLVNTWGTSGWGGYYQAWVPYSEMAWHLEQAGGEAGVPTDR
jgi:hypothetical protein